MIWLGVILSHYTLTVNRFMRHGTSLASPRPTGLHMESIAPFCCSIETINSYIFKEIVNHLELGDCVVLWHSLAPSLDSSLRPSWLTWLILMVVLHVLLMDSFRIWPI